MKVTVNTFLNVRVGQPSVNAPCYQYLAPGSELEVDGKMYNGDLFEGSSLWMRDEANNYYWASGLDIPDANPATPIKKTPNVKYNYNELINLPPEIRATKGKGVLVAILDTGCFNHPMVKNSIKAYYDIPEPTRTTPTDLSDSGHGTFVAGLIAANELPSAEMIGVAPEADLLVLRVADNENGFSLPNVIAALQKIKQSGRKPDIVNMSFDVYSQLQGPDFEQLLAGFPDTLFVAAGQDPITDNRAPYIYYPAASARVLAVGAFNKNNVAQGSQAIHPHIAYAVPDTDYHSLNNSYVYPYNTGKGSSFATALVSGSLALVLAYLKTHPDPAGPTKYLNGQLKKAATTPFDIKPNLYLP